MSELMRLSAIEVDWGIVGSTVITGIVVVFLILAILVAFLWLMGKILGEKKKKPSSAPAPAPAPAAPKPAPAAIIEEEEEDDGELIAVISAAIAAYSEADGVQYRITRIKKSEKTLRSGWSAAGIAENTRPF